MKSIHIILLLSSGTSSAFYMPWVHPVTFQAGDEVVMNINAITSVHTQIPLDFYAMPFCKPMVGPMTANQSLGESLTGNKIQNSPYSLKMRQEVRCAKLCQTTLNETSATLLDRAIRERYRNNWIVDGLPAAAVDTTSKQKKPKHYAGGFPIGFIGPHSKERYVNNHVTIIVDYHEIDSPPSQTQKYRVVGFAVEPMSVKHEVEEGYEWYASDTDGDVVPLTTCSGGTLMSQERIQRNRNQIVRAEEKILYTYDVTWRASKVHWASRWDTYLSEDRLVPAQPHWYSVTHSFLLAWFFLSLIVAIVVRNVRRDIAGNDDITEPLLDADEVQSGWMSLQADVFRPPTNYPMVYTVFVGSGVQLFMTALLLIVSSTIGVVSPAIRGSFTSAVLVLYALCGSIAGYTSAVMYKSFGGRQWIQCAIFTATLFPGMAFVLFVFVNTCLHRIDGAVAATLVDVLMIGCIWCFLEAPLVLLGAFLGKSQMKEMEFPSSASPTSRPIPKPNDVTIPEFGATVIIVSCPLGVALVEFLSLMDNLWLGQYYFVFGLTSISWLLMCISCAEVCVLMVYFQLSLENHRWWWYSFIAPGGAASYTFGSTSMFWFFGTLKASPIFTTYFLYFGYMLLFCFATFLVIGSVGSLISLWFVRMIYSKLQTRV